MAGAHPRRSRGELTGRVRGWPAGLAALIVLLVLLLVGFIVVALVQASDSGREQLLRSLAQVSAQFLLAGVVGFFIKEYLDDRREERRRQDALDRFRLDVLRRLVGTANTVRRAGITLDAERSAEAYVEQMRSLTDAYLNLRLLMHEVTGSTDLRNPIFPDWDEIKPHLHRMRDYLHACVREFRDKRAQLQPFGTGQQPPAEPVGDVWADISSFPRVTELLVEDPHPTGQPLTAIWIEFFGPYQEAIRLIRRAILRGGTGDTGHAGAATLDQPPDLTDDEDEMHSIPESHHRGNE
jgi:hypothetical protein